MGSTSPGNGKKDSRVQPSKRHRPFLAVPRTYQREAHKSLIRAVTRFSFAAFTGLVLYGCGSMSEFRNVQEKGPSIFIAGSFEKIREAAILALAEKRLSSPTIEQTSDGAVIYAEQSGLAAIAFNSYGGYGRVTISRAGATGNYSVSAVTRSRARNEPVGQQDVLKGYNYNDPTLAIGILDRIDQITKQTR